MSIYDADDITCGEQDEAPQRIRWEDGHYSTSDGYAGTNPVHLFTISYRTQRDKPAWQMRSHLPGLQNKQWEDDDRDALMWQAEVWLARFVGSLGATFPGQEG